ncbi:glycosyl transferase family 1 [Oceanobacillus zhaokaii]|uniref:Glycosyl transferase family 1 n=1 Tax=Oceanobacillus zhaokaii TaxID=2052660 RepID=A0A345PD27_9BACI|nr:glycosyltransferase [Oceanobacillus zhaokaii]AXI07907.1 glycosyl transferase family 1 [Oceanobacillus zhaokaii]
MGKKILFISDHGDPLAKLGGKQSGGQNNYVRQLALALDKRGVNVDVVTHWSNPEAPRTEVFGKNCRVFRIAAGHKGYIAKSEMYHLLPKFFQELKDTVQLHTYDIIHSHYWLSGLLALFVKRSYNIPIVHTSHSLAAAKKKATGKVETKRMEAEKAILRRADKVIATTENEKQLIENFANPKADVAVAAIGVDSVFHPYEKKRRHITKTFSFAGRLEKTKGIFTLLEAFRLYNKQFNNKGRLIIAGGDESDFDPVTKLPVNDELRKTVSGIEDKVDFLGPKTQEELAELFNNSTAVIVPSYYESFGMVAAEAQACGTPVIASAVGGLNDVVADGISGLHIRPKDSVKLSEAMKLLSRDNFLAKSLGKEAAERARNVFNWTTIANQIDGIYEKLMNVHDYASASDNRTLAGDKDVLKETYYLL